MEILSHQKTNYSSIQLKRNSVVFIIFLLICCLPVYGLASTTDNKSINGKVTDIKGQALDGVTALIQTADGHNIAYAITNSDGHFTLSYPRSVTEGMLYISCIGYKKLSIPLERLKNKAEYVLEEEAFLLKEVTVRVPHIKASGDTLTYNVDAFKSDADRTIEDVIRKLPGIRVSEEGRIYYNGEAINKFYIEGLDLLSGRYAIASRNISPDDVASVNIYENHQARRVLQDIEYSNKAAVNLRLKRKRTLRPVGHVAGGAGVDYDKEMLWKNELFGYLISPKNQILLSTKANNTGNTYRDETKILTDNDVSVNTIAAGIYSETSFGSAKIPASRYYDNRSGTASINTISRVGQNSTINVVADYTDDDFNYECQQMSMYAMGENDVIIIDESTQSAPHIKEAKFGVTAENNADKRYVSDKFAFAGRFNSDNYDVMSKACVGQSIRTEYYKLSNVVDAIFKVSDNVINFKSETQIGTVPINRLTAISDGQYTVFQNISGRSVKNAEYMTYSRIISARAHVGLKSSFDFEYDQLQSRRENPEMLTTNNVSGHKSAVILEPSFRYRTKKDLRIDLSIPLIISHTAYRDWLNDKRYPSDRFDLEFKASVNHATSFNLKTMLTVGRKARLGGLADYVTSPINVTFRQTSVLGTGNMNARTSHYANCNLTYRNAIEGLFSSAAFMLMRVESNRLGGLDVTAGKAISSSYKSVDNKSDVFNANFSVSKILSGLNTVVALAGSYEKFKRDMIRRDKIVGIDMNNSALRLSINSNPWKNALIMMLDAQHLRSRQRVGHLEQENRTGQSIVSCSIAWAAVRNVDVGARCYYSRYRLGGGFASADCLFLDANIRYRAKRIEIELSARNITNAKEYAQYQVKDWATLSHAVRLRPAEALISVRYGI